MMTGLEFIDRVERDSEFASRFIRDSFNIDTTPVAYCAEVIFVELTTGRPVVVTFLINEGGVSYGDGEMEEVR